MSTLKAKITSALDWIVRDYRSNRIRFIAECMGWVFSVGGSLTMAATMPNPPFTWLYPMWMCNTLLFATCAWSRGSLGLLSNYFLLFTIDVFGYYKWLSSP